MTRFATVAQIASFGLVASAAMLLALHAPRPAAAEPAGCGVYGQVLDRYSQPVTGIHLRLARGAELLNTVTDEQGRYRFEAGSIAGRTAEAFDVPLSVELLSRESARSPGRFAPARRELRETVSSADQQVGKGRLSTPPTPYSPSPGSPWRGRSLREGRWPQQLAPRPQRIPRDTRLHAGPDSFPRLYSLETRAAKPPSRPPRAFAK